MTRSPDELLELPSKPDMSEMPSGSIRDVRSHMADVVDRADRDDEPTMITRRGKPVAAIVPIEVLRRYQESEEREINRIVDERMSSLRGATPAARAAVQFAY